MVTLQSCSQDTKVCKRDFEAWDFVSIWSVNDAKLICYFDSDWCGDIVYKRSIT